MNLKTASKKIAASLRYARSKATSENTDYLVVFDFENRRMTVKSGLKTPPEREGEEERDIDSTESEGRSKSYDLPEGIRIEKGVSGDEEVDSDLFQIAFFPDGDSSGGKVFLSNDRGNQYEIQVDFITGMVRLGAVSSEQ